MQERATDRTGGAASDTDARVVLCSWCAARVQPRVARLEDVPVTPGIAAGSGVAKVSFQD